MGVWRSASWPYPEKCANGHPWGPGSVIVSWVACDCLPALDARKRMEDTGHLAVHCLGAVGCPSVWYRPRCELRAGDAVQPET